jgi:poly-gamma-glutamate capsule biosynthesis protein CapA/YwtB (metallophosphatase superfamily)
VSRALALVAILGTITLAVLAVQLAGAPAASGPGNSTHSDGARISLSSQLPSWVAPGVRVVVAGFAGGNQPVRLRLGGCAVARARSGPLGRFRIALAAPRPGRYAVSVASDGVVQHVGVLVTRAVTLAAVGDVTSGEQVGASVGTLGAAYPWASVGPVLRKADLATANLEGAVSTRGVPVPNKEYHFRGPASLLRAAHTVGGLDVVTVANNHAGDYGSQALLDTVRDGRAAGLLVVGGGVNEGAAVSPAIATVGGLRIAFVGFSDVNPAGFNAGLRTPGTAKADPAVVAAAIRGARHRADIVVAWFHWGTELHPEPSARQHELAAVALGAGAQVVLGAHPHVFGGVETAPRRSVVAWTLGNFVFPAISADTARTGILLVSLDRHGVRGWRVRRATIHGFRPVLDEAGGA